MSKVIYDIPSFFPSNTSDLLFCILTVINIYALGRSTHGFLECLVNNLTYFLRSIPTGPCSNWMSLVILKM